MVDDNEELHSGFQLPDLSFGSKVMEGITELAHRQRNPVIPVFEALQRYIGEFEASLSPDQEVGARLVSFGQAIVLHVRQIGYSAPNLIVFDGDLDGGGERVRLVQHVTQLSFLLMVVARHNQGPRRPIGFVANE